MYKPLSIYKQILILFIICVAINLTFLNIIFMKLNVIYKTDKIISDNKTKIYFNFEDEIEFEIEDIKIKVLNHKKNNEYANNVIDIIPKYEITEEEREMLAILVFLEAGIESFECKKGVVSVIFNRLDNKYLNAETLYEIIYAKNQFSPSKLIEKTTPYVCDEKEYEKSEEFITRWDDCFEAVDEIVMNGSVFPNYVMYFRSKYHFKKNGYVGYDVIDNTYFGFYENDKIAYAGGDSDE